MESKQIKIGEIEKRMFRKYNMTPNQNYRCGVELDLGMTLYFNCSTNGNGNIINVSLGMDFPFPELNFHRIVEIKDENGNILK